MNLESPIVQRVLTHDQGGPEGEEQGETPGGLWYKNEILSPAEDTGQAEVTLASYGEPQDSWDSTAGPSPLRELSTIDTALGSNEEAHNSGDSSSEGEADTTLVDEGSDCEIVTVCQLRSGIVFRVPIKVQGQSLFAVMDTAAEVTLIAEEVYRSLKSAPPILREVIMNTAGKGMPMNGYVVGPVNIGIEFQAHTVQSVRGPDRGRHASRFRSIKGSLYRLADV
ncbi:unnamed protein product [Mytilus coruscus]|uniref:Peptidase A2 domain-containing protein n=1 Tax=Mytilus coruscus TaxID=42192 RepID=A0A6J8ALF4_MYTCO|nr:unnamed protein product [Mytilus coruscus]